MSVAIHKNKNREMFLKLSTKTYQQSPRLIELHQDDCLKTWLRRKLDFFEPPSNFHDFCDVLFHRGL